MNTNKQRSSHRTPIYRRPVVILTFFGLLILAAIIVFFIVSHMASPAENPVDSDDIPWEEVPRNYEDTPEGDEWEPKIKQYEGEDVNKAGELTGAVSYQDVDADKNVTIYTVIDQMIETGSCTLNLKQGNNILYSTTVDAHADITTSICEPFTFSAAQISSGTYQIEIQISGDNKTGLINSEVSL